MWLLKRLTPQLIILLTLMTISTIGIVTEKAVGTSGSYVPERRTVIIDAGHGGFDGGAVAADGTVEKDINLNISKKLEQMLSLSGYDVIMTRTEDVGTDDTESKVIASRKKSDLKNRLMLMKNHPDAIYVSVHLNKFTTSAASGAQVFYTGNFPEAKTLGQYLQENIVNMLEPTNKRVIKQGTSATYLLHNATVPAVIVECGFLSNKNDLNKLKDEEYRSKMAFAIFSGILRYYEQQG